MKKIYLAAIMALVSLNIMAMSESKIRYNARAISDRMAYELNLTDAQYNDCYEINYDFIYAVSDIMDDVAYGYSDAIETYYTYLDYRNEDLSYVLSTYQYERFLAIDYFYRPIITSGRSWSFRLFSVFPSYNFYRPEPYGFRIYVGGHARHYYAGGFYRNRHLGFDHYRHVPIRGGIHFDGYRRHDFGPNYYHRSDRFYGPDQRSRRPVVTRGSSRVYNRGQIERGGRYDEMYGSPRNNRRNDGFRSGNNRVEGGRYDGGRRNDNGSRFDNRNNGSRMDNNNGSRYDRPGNSGQNREQARPQQQNREQSRPSNSGQNREQARPQQQNRREESRPSNSGQNREQARPQQQNREQTRPSNGGQNREQSRPQSAPQTRQSSPRDNGGGRMGGGGGVTRGRK